MKHIQSVLHKERHLSYLLAENEKRCTEGAQSRRGDHQKLRHGHYPSVSLSFLLQTFRTRCKLREELVVLIAKHKSQAIPAVWGEGSIVSLSGYQEETKWDKTLVGNTMKLLGVRFRLPFIFQMILLENASQIDPRTCRFSLAGGDLISGFWGDQEFTLSPLECDSFVGQIPRQVLYPIRRALLAF